MSLQLRWVGENEMDRVADVRMRCYAHSSREIERYREGIRADQRAEGNAFLLAEQNGVAVGTAASLSLQMWARGAKIACQGIAYVGTIKTHRRGTRGPGGGIATQLMNEAIRRARDQQLPATALMPFRASFYEHFGYGTVETRHNWTIPLSVLPTGGFDSIRYYETHDRSAMEAARQRSVERGQCDIERPDHYWEIRLQSYKDGFLVVDRPSASGQIHGYLALQHAREDGADVLKVISSTYDDVPALQRQFHFLASLRDQYAAVAYPFPADIQTNWLLREVQLPHRPVTHPTPEVRISNRLQVRVLDHQKFIEPLQLPTSAKGRAIVAVRETEGHVSKFSLDVSEGRATVTTSGSTVDFECADRVWAAIACGELPASQAAAMGLATASSSSASAFLDLFSRGPRPFCTEGF